MRENQFKEKQNREKMKNKGKITLASLEAYSNYANLLINFGLYFFTFKINYTHLPNILTPLNSLTEIYTFLNLPSLRT